MTIESINIIIALKHSNLYSECPNQTRRQRLEWSAAVFGGPQIQRGNKRTGQSTGLGGGAHGAAVVKT